jgi:preprotein translocase subunit SecE
MPAEDTLENKRKRRRELRRQQAESAAVESVAEEVESLDEADESEEEERGLTAGKGRATPGRRTQEVELAKGEGNFITRRFRGLAEYWEGVRDEARKVVWPTREETRRLTAIVLTVTIIASVVLGAISLGFSAVIAAGLNSPLLVFGGLFGLAVVAFILYLRSANRRTRGF